MRMLGLQADTLKSKCQISVSQVSGLAPQIGAALEEIASQPDDYGAKPPTSRSTALVVLALRLLANQNPVLADELNHCRSQILNKHHRRTDDENKILRAIGQGYHVPAEISQATRIPLKTVYKRLGELLERDIVYRSRQSAAAGRGGDGRGFLYWLP